MLDQQAVEPYLFPKLRCFDKQEQLEGNMLNGAGTLQGSWLVLSSPQGGAGICQAAAEVPMQPAEAGQLVWLQFTCLSTGHFARLQPIWCPFSNATAWEVGRGDAEEERSLQLPSRCQI